MLSTVVFNYCCWLQNLFFCKLLRIIVICTDAKLFILNSSITHALKSTTIKQNNAKQLYLTFVYTNIYLSVHTVVVFFLITSVKTWWKFFPILRWTHPWKESIRSCNHKVSVGKVLQSFVWGLHQCTSWQLRAGEGCGGVQTSRSTAAAILPDRRARWARQQLAESR